MRSVILNIEDRVFSEGGGHEGTLGLHAAAERNLTQIAELLKHWS